MTGGTQGQRRSHERWFPVLTLVAVATMVNYLDRTVLGILNRVRNEAAWTRYGPSYFLVLPHYF